MKKYFFPLLIINLFLVSYTPHAQGLNIEWQNTIGGSNNDFMDGLTLTSDGGYILSATSRSGISGDKTENPKGGNDFWVIKLNSLGTIEWEKTIGGQNDESLERIIETNDGGFILGGTSSSGITGDKTEASRGGGDFWIVKLNSSGNVEWDKTYGGNASEFLYTMDQTVDGGLIVGGSSSSDISGDKTEDSNGFADFWIIKLNSSGEMEWQNTIGGSNSDNFRNISPTADGGYILGGVSLSNISGDKTEDSIGMHDIWIVKLNASGQITWQNTIGGTLDDHLSAIYELSTGGYILGGTSESNISGDKSENSFNNTFDLWLVKMNANGEVIWDNTIGGNNYDGLSNFRETLDNGFILAASSWSNISGDKTENSNGFEDYWIIKVDSNGTIIAQNTIGGSSNDLPLNIIQSSDGGYVVGGQSLSNSSGDKTENSNGALDIWIVKLSPQTLGIGDLSLIEDFIIYPNPVKNRFYINNHDKINKIRIYNCNGALVENYLNQITNSLDISHLNSGLYLVEFLFDNGSLVKKLIKD